MIPRTLLDSDTVIELMKQRPIVIRRSTAYVRVHQKLSFSAITRYEVLRGLNFTNKPAEIADFNQACVINDVVPLSDAIINRAAEIYAGLRRKGDLIPDADILIAATALEHGLVLATNNEKHFSRIPSLVIDNWLK